MLGTPLNEQLADIFVTRSVNLLRFEAHVRRRILAELKKLEVKLVANILQSDPAGPTRTAFQQARLEALLKQTRETIRTSFKSARDKVDRELVGMAKAEVDWNMRSINDVVGADVLSVAVPETSLQAIVSDVLIEGSPSREWWNTQAGSLAKKFSQQMRQGLLLGETNEQLVQRVRGTRANQYTDGLIRGVSRRNADALVRTSVSAVNGAAREQLYRANGDVVKGTQHQSTLDGRTTEICMAYSGACWDLDGNILPESPVDVPYRPLPMHWGERSVRIPVLHSLKDMLGGVGSRKASQLSKLPEGTQASMDGQVPASLTFEQWLKTKPEDFQKEKLGPGRWQLWKDGKINMVDLIDQSGRPVSLKKLEAL